MFFARRGGVANPGRDSASAALPGKPFFLASFSSDWLFPTEESRAVVRALNRAAANAGLVEIATDKGHDALLLEEPDFHQTLGGFRRGAGGGAGEEPDGR